MPHGLPVEGLPEGWKIKTWYIRRKVGMSLQMWETTILTELITPDGQHHQHTNVIVNDEGTEH